VTRDIVSVALVGLGDIGLRAHLPALLHEPRVSVVALSDLDEQRLGDGRTRAPDAWATQDAVSVIEDPGIDAVVLATPPWVTPGLARRAVACGKYVLAEKPLAPSVAATAEVAGEAQARARLQIGLTYRHHPAVERLRELCLAGDLGAPLLVQASICDEPADPDVDPDGFARRLRSLEHGPPVISDGVHACDRLNFVLEATPVRVHGWGLRSDSRYASDNANVAVLEYEGGTLVRLEVVWLFPVLPPSQFVVTGPLGRAVLDPPTFSLAVDLVDGTHEELTIARGKTEVCFERQLTRFVDHCLAGTPPVPGIDEALASLELAERIAVAAGAFVMDAP
jgi:myo-inositol 2-dehydrogenase / D-chiro-inositol 1-dehydrogenase